MGRPKKEMKKIHAKKIKKAKEKIKAFRKGDISSKELNSLSKKLIKRPSSLSSERK